ncbi:MAG: glycosyltransferase family 2 protein [Candidatus Pacearchaeota archaeon]|jgi:glycosyltransferase involved in cell wall biosynthesis
MDNPIISVIMPAFNAEKYLVEAIDSILNQTFKDFEFIIINDGSTDKTLDIINKYISKDKRIILINNLSNQGIIKSLNLGLKISKGKYIARMDADDISIKDRLEIQYKYLEKNPNIFLLGSGAIDIDESGNKLRFFHPLTSFDLIKSNLPIENCFYHPTIMFRNNKEIFYKEKMLHCEDYDLYLRLLSQNYILMNIPNILLKHRLYSSSISSLNKDKQDFYVKKAKEEYKKIVL